MTALLISKIVVMWCAGSLVTEGFLSAIRGDRLGAAFWIGQGLALIAVALWLAYAAGGA